MLQNTCFILMPFTKAPGLEKQDLDYIYEHILKKAVSTYQKNGTTFFSQVTRFENKVGSIISGIVNNLNTAELVIADLTGLNPNVMYELGVRHALRRGTIIITQDLTNLPSDLRDYLTVEYKYSDKTPEQPNLYNSFEKELHRTIDEILKTNRYDSPVLSYLKQKQFYRNEAEIENLKSNAVIIEIIGDLCVEISFMIENYEKREFNSEEETLVIQLFNLKLNNLSTALHELNIPYDSTILYENLITTKTLLAEVSKLFNTHDYFQSNFGALPDLPDGVLGKGIKNSDYINKHIVDLFHLLAENDNIRFTSMKELFKNGGKIETELLDYLIEYIENKAKSLGVDTEELELLSSR